MSTICPSRQHKPQLICTGCLLNWCPWTLVVLRTTFAKSRTTSEPPPQKRSHSWIEKLNPGHIIWLSTITIFIFTIAILTFSTECCALIQWLWCSCLEHKAIEYFCLYYFCGQFNIAAFTIYELWHKHSTNFSFPFSIPSNTQPISYWQRCTKQRSTSAWRLGPPSLLNTQFNCASVYKEERP